MTCGSRIRTEQLRSVSRFLRERGIERVYGSAASLQLCTVLSSAYSMRCMDPRAGRETRAGPADALSRPRYKTTSYIPWSRPLKDDEERRMGSVSRARLAPR